MARVDPTLITFRLPQDVVRDIMDRADCPPPSGSADRLGGTSLWVRQLVMRELGLDDDADTSQARERRTSEFLLAVTAYWRAHRVVVELQAEADKKARSWSSKMTRAEKHLAMREHRLEEFSRVPSHRLGCDCQECQQAAGLSQG